MKRIYLLGLIFFNSICFAQPNFQLNKKIETGATVKKIEQSKQSLKITVYMKNKTAKKIPMLQKHRDKYKIRLKKLRKHIFNFLKE